MKTSKQRLPLALIAQLKQGATLLKLAPLREILRSEIDLNTDHNASNLQEHEIAVA